MITNNNNFINSTSEIAWWKLFRNKYIFKLIFSNFKYNEIYHYDRSFNVVKILESFSNGTEIIKDKIKSKKYLSFNNLTVFDSNKNGLIKIFETIYKSNNSNNQFYQQLFKNYSKIFSNLEFILPIIIKTSNITALKQYINHLNKNNNKSNDYWIKKFKSFKKTFIINSYKSFKMYKYLKDNYKYPESTIYSKTPRLPNIIKKDPVFNYYDSSTIENDEYEEYEIEIYNKEGPLVIEYIDIFEKSIKFKQFLKICKIISIFQLYNKDKGNKTIHFNLDELDSIKNQFNKDQLQMGILKLLKSLNRNIGYGHVVLNESKSTLDLNENLKYSIYQLIKIYYSNFNEKENLPKYYRFMFSKLEILKEKYKKSKIKQFFSRCNNIEEQIEHTIKESKDILKFEFVYFTKYINKFISNVIKMDSLELLKCLFENNEIKEIIRLMKYNMNITIKSIKSIKTLEFFFEIDKHQDSNKIFSDRNLGWESFRSKELFQYYISRIRKSNGCLEIGMDTFNKLKENKVMLESDMFKRMIIHINGKHFPPSYEYPLFFSSRTYEYLNKSIYLYYKHSINYGYNKINEFESLLEIINLETINFETVNLNLNYKMGDWLFSKIIDIVFGDTINLKIQLDKNIDKILKIEITKKEFENLSISCGKYENIKSKPDIEHIQYYNNNGLLENFCSDRTGIFIYLAKFAESGNLEAFKFLFLNNSDYILDRNQLRRIYANAIISNSMEIIEFLLQKCPSIFTKSLVQIVDGNKVILYYFRDLLK